MFWGDIKSTNSEYVNENENKSLCEPAEEFSNCAESPSKYMDLWKPIYLRMNGE
jgi:hypothetical protein